MEGTFRKRLVLCLAANYGASMLIYRQTIMVTMPTVLEDLGLPVEAGGRLMSLGASTYMITKPLCQAMVDFMPATRGFQLSIAFSGLTFLAMGFATSLWHLEILVVVLHVSQSPIYPTLTQILNGWYEKHERGTPFSIIQSALPISCSAVPSIAAAAMTLTNNWRTVYLFTGIVAVATVILTFPFICDGKPPVSEEDLKRCKGDKDSSWISRVVDLLMRLELWGVGISLTLLYTIRFGVEGWIASYLVKGVGTGTETTVLLNTAWQLGGFIGVLAVGPASDHIFHGARTPLICGCTMGLTLSLVLLPSMGPSSMLPLLAVGAAAGACVFALRVLYMLLNRDIMPASVASLADAVVQVLAELGGVFAGLPLIKLVQATDWTVYPRTLLAVSTCLCFFSFLLRSSEQATRHKLE